MKKMIYKMGILVSAVLVSVSPLTVFASSKTLTDPLVVTEAEIPEDQAPGEGPLIPCFLHSTGNALTQGDTLVALSHKGSTVHQDHIQIQALGHLLQKKGLSLPRRRHHNC